ncbi:MAG: HAMP domain-containing sensor histidine kinase [Pseudomonadota bacterium]
MSLPPPRSFVGSTVFRRTVWAILAGLIGVLAIVWGAYALNHWQIHQEVKASILESEFELVTAYEEEGLEDLVHRLSFDDRTIWDPEWMFAILEENETIVRLVNAEGETLAGYEHIDPPGGWSQTFLDHEDLDGHPVIALRLGLGLGLEGGDANLIIAKFLPDRLIYMRELLVMGTWLLAIAVFPIALATGWFTSRSVFARLNTLSETAERVGKGSLQARVPLKGNGDEFDRLSSAVNDMLDQIGTLARNLEGVSVGAAHDLKTPVSNLAGRLQLIERDMDDPSATKAHIDVAQKHIDSLLRTLDALFRLGEIEAGKRKAAFRTLNVSELVEDLADSFQPVFEEADKTLEVRTSPRILIQGDSDLLTQMVSNLLENIIEHARDGAHAKIRLRASDNLAHLEIGDDGPGLPALKGEDIFERFFRLDPSRTTAGNGLGLSLVRSIAQLHDGTAALIAFEPGAVFEVTLPLAPKP